MSKNKKKLTPEQIRKKKVRRFKKKVKRLIILGLIAFCAYGVYKPEAIAIEPLNPYFTMAHEYVFENDWDLQDKVNWLMEKSTEKFLTVAKQIKLPTKFTGLPEEVVVEEVVSNFTDEVKHLPENQVKKVKVRICQDVIDEATMSAER